MPQFAPDQVTFRDPAGYGDWDIAHGREHLQFVQVLSARTPPIVLPEFPLYAFLGTAGDVRNAIMQSHWSAHQLLQSALGITSTDLTGFDLDQEGDFYSFLSYHSTEHAAIRQALGIT